MQTSTGVGSPKKQFNFCDDLTIFFLYKSCKSTTRGVCSSSIVAVAKEVMAAARLARLEGGLIASSANDDLLDFDIDFLVLVDNMMSLLLLELCTDALRTFDIKTVWKQKGTKKF